MRPSIQRALTEVLPGQLPFRPETMDLPPTPQWSPLGAPSKSARACKSGWLDTFDALDTGTLDVQDYFSIPVREEPQVHSELDEYRRERNDRHPISSTQPLHHHLAKSQSTASLPSTPNGLSKLRQRCDLQSNRRTTAPALSLPRKHTLPTPPPSASPPQTKLKVKVKSLTNGDITAFRFARDSTLAKLREHIPHGSELYFVHGPPGSWAKWDPAPVADDCVLRALIASCKATIRFVAI